MGTSGCRCVGPRLIAAAGAAAATPTAGTRAGRGFVAIGGRGENRQLQRLLPALAFRARNRGLPIHNQALVVLAAIVTNVFVDRHNLPSLSYQGIIAELTPNSPKNIKMPQQMSVILPHPLPVDAPASPIIQRTMPAQFAMSKTPCAGSRVLSS